MQACAGALAFERAPAPFPQASRRCMPKDRGGKSA